MPAAKVEVVGGRDSRTSVCDRAGRCRIGLTDVRSVRVAAAGHATRDLSAAALAAAAAAAPTEPTRVVLEPAASLAVTLRDPTGATIADQEIEVQVSQPGPAGGVAQRLSRWTDAAGLAVFDGLADTEYVVRCKRRGPWLGATAPAVRPPTGDRLDLVLEMRSLDRSEYFEVEVDDPARRMQWTDDASANYVVVVEGRTRAVHVPRHGRAVVAGRPGERIGVRLAEVEAGPPRALRPRGDWIFAVTGQRAPLKLTTTGAGG